MSVGPSLTLLRDIQTLFDSGTAAGLTDRQLLERFIARRDASAEEAFEVLILRHGPMVLRVCRNALADPNDIHDAFQATFLILVKQRGSIRRLESVGSWLFGVATRVAARARVEAARRRAAERRAALRVAEAVDFDGDDDAGQADFGKIVQEEVRRLPEKYRAVVLLCYWEGLTQEQAAAQLGCPLGTVRSRLARARNLLHRRLMHRGLAARAGAISAAVHTSSASAAAIGARLPSVAPELVRSTTRAAAQLAGGKLISQVSSALTVALIQRVVWSMTMVKMSSAGAALVILGLAGYGAGITALRLKGPDEASRADEVRGKPTAQGNSAAQARGRDAAKTNRPRAEQKPGPFEKIYSDIKGQTTIIMLKANGSVVKKGEVVCELDSASVRDQLVNQRITTASARANFQNAKLEREGAELAKAEYTDEVFPREEREAAGEVEVAESELAVGEEEFKAIKSDDQLALKRAKLAVARAKLALVKAKNRHHILTNYTKGARVKDLTSSVEKARSDELAKQAVCELERSKEEKLERRITACTIRAPIDGTLVYADSASSGALQIEEGALVRERQLLFQIIPASPPKVGPQ
jgi:RNA polymerase sigma factor (sigma-70 family)